MKIEIGGRVPRRRDKRKKRDIIGHCKKREGEGVGGFERQKFNPLSINQSKTLFTTQGLYKHQKTIFNVKSQYRHI